MYKLLFETCAQALIWGVMGLTTQNLSLLYVNFLLIEYSLLKNSMTDLIVGWSLPTN